MNFEDFATENTVKRRETSRKIRKTYMMNCFQSTGTQNNFKMFVLLSNVDLHVFTASLELVLDSDGFLLRVFCLFLSSFALKLNS